MPVFHDLKCIYVHIPKTGGTSIEAALGILGDWNVENTLNMFGLIKSPNLKEKKFLSKFLQHLTAAQLRDVLGNQFELYYRFTFVRNPWDRMVSIFFKKDQNLLEQAISFGLNSADQSFIEFLESTENIAHIHLDRKSVV